MGARVSVRVVPNMEALPCLQIAGIHKPHAVAAYCRCTAPCYIYVAGMAVAGRRAYCHCVVTTVVKIHEHRGCDWPAGVGSRSSVHLSDAPHVLLETGIVVGWVLQPGQVIQQGYCCNINRHRGRGEGATELQ